jgi:excisionase family DNA binding protein
MSKILTNHEVLTLEEAAEFLRVSSDAAAELANRGEMPGRCVRGEWRFLRGALEDWLRAPAPNEALLAQVGVLRDDDSLPAVLAQIYKERGRPETDGPTEG